ncbi:response regulator [Frateuria edaphi]|uniref:response regulator transcription factor n=1 Tax=Frateuria edaphi TaxID=2898793 RepID=UPI001E63910D|nr:response regulator [Frateuria edaphi]UGB45447.1 response regulator [Frateuria edaphi]
MTVRRLVAIVDDDQSVRESLPDLLKTGGYDADVFASAEDFLVSSAPDLAACLVVDVYMPGMSGPALQEELARRRNRIAIVFMSAHIDANVRRELIARGAADCLFKPFNGEALLDAIAAAIDNG